MKIEDQVCSLEQAKRLKELGISQESYFHWQHFTKQKYRNESIQIVHPAWKECICDPGEAWSAFTVAEMLLMMHQTITINNLQCINPGKEIATHFINRIERGELTTEQCNERLSN